MTRTISKIQFKLFWVALGWASFSLSAWGASPPGEDIMPGSRWTSLRAAGMGNLYLSQVDQVGDSLFYNPAGLAKRPGFKAEPLDLQLGFNTDLMSQAGIKVTNSTSLSSYQSSLNTHPHTDPSLSEGVKSAFGFQGLGVGVMYRHDEHATSDGTTIRYRTLYQTIPTAGYGLRLASGVLRIGYSLQWVNQTSGDVSVPSNSTGLSYTNKMSEGAGFSHNIGSTLTLPYTYQPTVSVVARNIGGLKYTKSSIYKEATNSPGMPSNEDMSIDTEFHMINKLGGAWSSSWSFGYRDATNSSKASIYTHPAAGMEFSMGGVAFLRAGYSSGYPSAGLGVQSSKSEMNFAWYSNEIGGGFHTERDTRVGLNIVLKY